MAHTPGPWIPLECDGNADDLAIADNDGGYVCYSVATHADAELIAAAPELLAALKDAVEFINGHNECLEPSTHSSDREWIDHCVALHKSCQEAINKAEGRGE